MNMDLYFYPVALTTFRKTALPLVSKQWLVRCVLNSYMHQVLWNKNGFDILINTLNHFPKNTILIGIEDTNYYHFALLKYLLEKEYTVALINPNTTNLTRKLQEWYYYWIL